MNGSFVRRRLGLFGGFRGIFGSSLLPFRGRGSHGGEKRRRKGREGEGRRELRLNVQGGTIWSGRSQEFWWFSHGWQSPRLIPIRGSLPFVLLPLQLPLATDRPPLHLRSLSLLGWMQRSLPLVIPSCRSFASSSPSCAIYDFPRTPNPTLWQVLGVKENASIGEVKAACE